MVQRIQTGARKLVRIRNGWGGVGCFGCSSCNWTAPAPESSGKVVFPAAAVFSFSQHDCGLHGHHEPADQALPA